MKESKAGGSPGQLTKTLISLTASGSSHCESSRNKGWWLSHTPPSSLLTLQQAWLPQTESMALSSGSGHLCLSEVPPCPSVPHLGSCALWPLGKYYRLGCYRRCHCGPGQLHGFSSTPHLWAPKPGQEAALSSPQNSFPKAHYFLSKMFSVLHTLA